MVMLQTVEIPGFADAVRKERQLRDSAFLDGLEIVCGVEVKPLSLRRWIWLEHARNGFVVPCRFDSKDEVLAHALQVVWFNRPGFTPPTTPKYSFWGSLKQNVAQQAFFRKALRSGSPEVIIREVELWLEDAFTDALLGGGGSEVAPPSYASFPVFIVDQFAAAGLPFNYDDIMDMPLRRLWQHRRVAVQRLHDVSLSNPSDLIAVEYLAKVKT